MPPPPPSRSREETIIFFGDGKYCLLPNYQIFYMGPFCTLPPLAYAFLIFCFLWHALLFIQILAILASWSKWSRKYCNNLHRKYWFLQYSFSRKDNKYFPTIPTIIVWNLKPLLFIFERKKNIREIKGTLGEKFCLFLCSFTHDLVPSIKLWKLSGLIRRRLRSQ